MGAAAALQSLSASERRKILCCERRHCIAVSREHLGRKLVEAYE